MVCPRPWNVIECRIDLKSGGEFYTRMQGPQGEVIDNHGCIIEVIPTKRLVTTNIFHKGLRPVKIEDPDFPLGIKIELNDGDLEHKYRAIIRHLSHEHRRRHEDMGFSQGWNIALKQLERLFSL